MRLCMWRGTKLANKLAGVSMKMCLFVENIPWYHFEWGRDVLVQGHVDNVKKNRCAKSEMKFRANDSMQSTCFRGVSLPFLAGDYTRGWMLLQTRPIVAVRPSLTYLRRSYFATILQQFIFHRRPNYSALYQLQYYFCFRAFGDGSFGIVQYCIQTTNCYQLTVHQVSTFRDVG